MKIEWNICRICLLEGDLKSINNLDEEDISVRNKIELCSGIQLSLSNENVSLPEEICKNCLAFANVSYRFRLMCHKANEKLLKMIDFQLTNKFPVSETAGNEGNVIAEATIPCIEVSLDYIVTVDENPLDNGEPIHIKIDPKSSDRTDVEHEDEEVTYYEDFTPAYNYDISEDIKIDTGSFDINTAIPPQPTESSVKRNLRKKRKKTGDKPSICEYCGEEFRKSYMLARHINMHTGKKKLECEFCGKDFGLDKSGLTRHRRIHTGEKPFLCHICGKAFNDQSSRDKHVKLKHTGERNYKCNQCEKSFIFKYCLQRHMVVHTNERIWGCDLCNHKFADKSHLTAHEKTLRHQQKLAAITTEAAETEMYIIYK